MENFEEVDRPYVLSTNIVLRALREADLTCNNRILGSQLGLGTRDLDTIGGDCSNPYSEMYRVRVIDSCLDRAELTWNQLVTTLRQPALKMFAAAKRIEKKYITPRSSSASETMSSPPHSPVSMSSPFPLEDSMSHSNFMPEQTSMSLVLSM